MRDSPKVSIGRRDLMATFRTSKKYAFYWKLKKELYDIIANHSGQEFDKVHHDSDRDYWMKADEAKAYGMVDEVLTK